MIIFLYSKPRFGETSQKLDWNASAFALDWDSEGNLFQIVQLKNELENWLIKWIFNERNYKWFFKLDLNNWVFPETYNQILKKLLQFHIDEQSCIRQYELKVTYIYINNILI